MEDQRPKKNELDEKFVIEEMYGTIGAYPGGIGATLVLAHVFITYIPATQVPSSLESSASRSQSLEETLSNLHLQDSPCSSTPSSPVSTDEESRYIWIFRNDSLHAEIKLLRQLELKVQQLEQEGNKVTKINVELIQNYASCHECADELIKFKDGKRGKGGFHQGNICKLLLLDWTFLYKRVRFEELVKTKRDARQRH